MKMSGLEFERKFIRIVDKLREEKGLTKRSLSESAFDDQSKPDQKYQRITREEQRLHLEDAFELAKSIGYGLPELIWRVLQEPD